MRQSWKKKLLATAAAGALALAMAPAAAFAASTDLTVDTKIKVEGIDSGDTAKYYKVVGQNSSTNAWELLAPFTNLNLADLDANTTIKAEHSTWKDLDYIHDGISAAEASVIAAKVTSSTTAAGNLDSSTFEATVEPGLYLVIITPAANNKDVVYKPVFVSADYSQENNNGGDPSTTAKVDIDSAKLATAVAKRSPLELTKTAATEDNKPDGVAVGDTVSFTVNTNLVTYTKNFVSPEYKITDELSDGLKLVKDSIVIKVDNENVAASNYTLTTTDDGFEIVFKPDYLYSKTGDPDVKITYDATVTTDAPMQVNQMDNTVKLVFSNDPLQSTSRGELEDKTRHYTFDIDGNVFSTTSGGSDGRTKEVEKVAVDADGNPVEVIKGSDYSTNLPEKHKPLAEAEFELTTEDGTAIYFKNGVKSTEAAGGSKVLKSETDGSIIMKGLDEGTYKLKETKAPAGYSFDPTKVYTINISAHYDEDADGYKTLLDYTVTINGNASTYLAGKKDGKPIPLDANNAVINAQEDDEETTDVDESPQSTLIINKKLGLLPSTGGSGIFFYLGVGAAIMALAVGLGMLKRRVTRRSTAAV